MGRLKLAPFAALLTSSAAAQQCGTITTCPPVSTPLAGTELLYVVQASVSKKMTVSQLATDIGPLVPLSIGALIVGGSAPNILVQLTNGLQDGSLGAHLSLSGLGALSTDATGSGILATKGDIPASLPPSGTAGGDLTGTYPNPTIAANAVTNAKMAVGAAVANLAIQGIVGDGTSIVGNVSITSGNAALSVSSVSAGAFAPGDVGKKIVVPGAGAAGGPLITTIATYVSASSVTLAANASTTLSSVAGEVFYGTDNSTSIQAALNAAAPGQLVYLPPAGKCYGIGTGLVVPPGVKFFGVGSSNLSFNPAQDTTFCATGTWLMSFDLTNPAILMGSATSATGINNGEQVDTINVYYPQNYHISFAPIVWPYAYQVSCNFCQLTNVRFIGATDGLNLLYNTSPSGTDNGKGAVVRNVGGEASQILIHSDGVNDTMQVHEIQQFFQHDNTTFDAYVQANLLGWDGHYTDNIKASDLNFANCNIGFKFTDGTTAGNTHSFYGGSVNNVDVNLCNQAMAVAATTTVVTGVFSNITYGQQGLSSPGVEFALASDNVQLSLANIQATPNSSGGDIFDIGNGTSGSLNVNGLTLLANVPAGKSLFGMGTGAIATLDGGIASYGTGATLASGGGILNLRTDRYGSWTPLGVFETPTFTGNGSYAGITAGNKTNPVVNGVHQMRISGQAFINVGQTGGSIALKLQNFNEIIVTGIAAVTSSTSPTFDSGWIDITSGSAGIGQLQANATLAVQYSFNALTVEYR